MPEITINGDKKNVSGGSITSLLEAEKIPSEHWKAMAVARNGQVIPKAEWASTQINAGDRIEIVKPFVGG